MPVAAMKVLRNLSIACLGEDSCHKHKVQKEEEKEMEKMMIYSMSIQGFESQQEKLYMSRLLSCG